MKVNLMVTMQGGFDSHKLYDIISMFGVNLTDLGSEVLVYGLLEVSTANRVVYHCSLFSNLVAEIKQVKDK
ncbi:MAG: hypothetical protein J6R32_00295 [Bacteroidales bacterium]|nr:hypothetical protein [Bacteroidales bacterium]